MDYDDICHKWWLDLRNSEGLLNQYLSTSLATHVSDTDIT